jgi:hypothetical protein
VLDGVNADRAFADCRRSLDRFQVPNRCVDRRFVLEIAPLELDPGIDRPGLQFQSDLLTCVQRRAAHARTFGECLLKLGRHSA